MIAKLYIYRLVDVAYDINIPELRHTLKKLQFRPLKLNYFTPAYLNFSVPPLEMDEKKWFSPFLKTEIKTQTKFYSLGSITVRFEINIEENSYQEIFNKAIFILNNGSTFEKKSKKLTEKLRELLEEQLKIKTYSGFNEDYAILWIQDKYNKESKHELKAITSQFLRNENRLLSDYEQNEAFKYNFSYSPEDLTIIDWDRAVTIGIAPEEDVWDVLEYTNLQLLQIRYYEQELDKRLEEIYEFSKAKRLPVIEFYKTQKLLKNTLELFIEFTSVEKRINSFLRLTGDEYLSRIYLAASNRLNLRRSQNDLKERLVDTKELYEMLSAEVSSIRAEILEIIIILLIVFEIIYAFV